MTNRRKTSSGRVATPASVDSSDLLQSKCSFESSALTSSAVFNPLLKSSPQTRTRSIVADAAALPDPPPSSPFSAFVTFSPVKDRVVSISKVEVPASSRGRRDSGLGAHKVRIADGTPAMEDDGGINVGLLGTARPQLYKICRLSRASR